MIRVFGLIFLILVLFQNCSDDVGFSQETSVVEPDINTLLSTDDEEADIGIINQGCDTQALKTQVINVQFPRLNNECAWNQEGNLERRDRFFQARIRQSQNLGLPFGAVICDADFDFDEQPFQYDDYFAFLFNDHVISSGYNFEDRLTPGNFGLLRYNWTQIAGAPMRFGSEDEQVYCPQIPGASIDCRFPGHDTPGRIDFDMDARYVRAIMSNGIPANHTFALITHGDNDNFDCEHSDIQFDVTVKYYVSE
jgi:hypothetical protein